ncbi:MAG: SIMPL domain-containing protein [Ignavibacteriota bacterium]
MAALASVAAAQQITVPPAVPYVKVHGDATISQPPDRVQLDVGVISQGTTSQAAADLNAKHSKTVIDTLRQALPAGNIQTVNFSVNPNYQYPKDGSPPNILGYTANNTVRLQIDDLSLLRKLIDAATKAGASNVNRLNFALRDESKARGEALGRAAEQARAGAIALAERLHVKLGRLLRVEEEQPVIVSPGRQVEFAATPEAGATGSTPIEPGSIDVHASVSLTFEVSQ